MTNRTATITPPTAGRTWELRELRESPVGLLQDIAEGMGIEAPPGMRKRDLVYEILLEQIQRDGSLNSE